MFIILNEYVFLDVSGGVHYSMLDEMRSALEVSNSLSFTKENYTPLSYKDVFHMATLGGAKGKVGHRILEMLFIFKIYIQNSYYNWCIDCLALSIEDKVGNFVPGKEFDALIIDLNAKDSLLDNFKEYTLEENFQRFIYSGDERNIISVYVNGREVK